MKNNIILRKFDYKNDLDILFNIMINSNDQMLFHGRIQLNSVPDFEKWFMGNLTHGYHDFYVVEDGEIDANYFQHKPYLDDFNAENGTKVSCVSYVHVEPMGLYGGKQTSLDAVK